MNSFIPWIGGKKMLSKKILSYFPKKYNKYIEVFGGAGWVLFGKEPSSIEIFNDLNKDLINLYRCMKYHSEELKRQLEYVPISRECFLDFKEQLNVRGLTDIQRATRYFYLVVESYGADINSFGLKARSISNKISKFPEIAKRLERVVIENKSFEQIIASYDEEDNLFYLDPPYHKSEQLYDVGFKKEDHYQLNKLLKQVKGKFVLSYNADDFIRELYQDFYLYEVERINNMSKCNRYKEFIITNFKEQDI